MTLLIGRSLLMVFTINKATNELPVVPNSEVCAAAVQDEPSFGGGTSWNGTEPDTL